MLWLILAAAQLFWLGVGLYIGTCWPSYWHKPRHLGRYQYAVRKPNEWPHALHAKVGAT